MTYKVIALDLDGTLLDPTKHILPESIEALAKAKNAGVKVVIVTGRHYNAIAPFYQALALDTPAICCNGALLYDYQENKVTDADPVNPEQAIKLLELLEKHQIKCLMYADDKMIYQEATGHITRTENWFKSVPESQRPIYQHVNALKDAAREVSHIWKFALTDSDTDKLHNIRSIIEDELHMSFDQSWHDQVDVAQKGISKGKRLEQWVTSQGLSMKDVIAFGDNYNDISMLEKSGLSVAMGNAVDTVKDISDRIIENNDQPGIAKVIEELFNK